MFLRVFGCIRTHSDAFGYIRTCSDAFGCIRMPLERLRNFQEFGHFLPFWDVFGVLGPTFIWILGIMGPTICGANYSELALLTKRDIDAAESYRRGPFFSAPISVGL